MHFWRGKNPIKRVGLPLPPSSSIWHLCLHCWYLLQALNGGGAGSGDEGDEKDEVESILLDPTYDWWNVWALFKRVFRSHRFKVNLIIIQRNLSFVYLIRFIFSDKQTEKNIMPLCYRLNNTKMLLIFFYVTSYCLSI